MLLMSVITAVCLADPTIDFLINSPTGGSIAYAGGSNPLVGSGIDVDGVVGIYGTPVNNNVAVTCFNCFMSFTTGGLQSTTPTQWLFNTGGSISLVGSVDTNRNNTLDAGDLGGLTGTTLFSGYFGGSGPVVLNFGVFNVTGAAFTSFVNAGLAGLYGLPVPPRGFDGNLNLSFFATSTPPSAFTSAGIGSGNVFASTPEPAASVLFGTVLVLCGAVLRRRRMIRS